jgi:hypothetical protein
MSLPFTNNTIQVYRYDTFSYTLTYPSAYSLQLGTVTSALVPFVTNNGSNVVFAATVFPSTISSNELFVVNALDFDGNVLARSSNTVNIGAGRFTDASGNSVSNTVLTLYKNEPMIPTRFQAFFPLTSTPTTTPGLPAGIGFVQVASNAFDLLGIPLVQVPSSNYLVIGRGDGGKIVSASNVNITVNAERVLLDVSGSSILSPVTIGTPITPRVITARYPPYTSPGGTLQYQWSTLPDGLVFTDTTGVPRSSPFTPSDASSTLILRGTPTETAARSLVPSGQSTISVNATRLLTPNITAATAFSLQFGETILFDTPNLCNFFVDIPISSSALSNSFHVQSYFSNATITNVFSPNLVSDISLSFNVAQQRAFLTGTPSNTSLDTYTIRAVSSSTLTSDLSATLRVDLDTVSFVTTPVDTCFTFIVSRSLDLSKTGYYSSNIQFRAVAESGCNVTYQTPQLTGTGITTVSSNGSIVLSGLPETVTPLTTLDVIASSPSADSAATTSIQFSIVPDTFTFTTLSNLTFLQNFPITPFQITATTLSERNVTSYAGINLPEGIQLSPTGILSGTPTSNTNRLDSSFSIIATTGFTTTSQSYSYTTLEDAVAFTPVSNVQLTIGQPIEPFTIEAFSYSGKPVSNLQFSNLDASYGLTLTSISNRGVISGTLTDANLPLLSNLLFEVQGSVGAFTGSETFNLATSNGSTFVRIMTMNADDGNTCKYYTSNDYVTNPRTLRLNTANEVDADPIPSGIGYTDIQATYPRLEGYYQSSNLIVAVRNTAYPQVSSNATTVTQLTGASTNFDRRLYQVTYDTCSNTWYGIGYVNIDDTTPDQVYLYTGGSNADDWDSTPREALTIQARYGVARSPYANGYIGGTCLRAKDGILMAGGRTMIRRVNNVWTSPVGQFNTETCCFNLDGPTWIAGGSDGYERENPSSTFTSNALTLKYSTDKGASWYNAAGGFNFTCFEVEYGSNQWLARGLSYSNGNYLQEIRYSSNGSNWALVEDIPATPGRVVDRAIFYPPGKINFDGLSWMTYMPRVNPYTSNNILDRVTYYTDAYQHDNVGSLGSSWTNVTLPTEEQLTFVFVQGFLIGNILGPATSVVFRSTPQTTTSLLTLEGKAVFKDPRV